MPGSVRNELVAASEIKIAGPCFGARHGRIWRSNPKQVPTHKEHDATTPTTHAMRCGRFRVYSRNKSYSSISKANRILVAANPRAFFSFRRLAEDFSPFYIVSMVVQVHFNQCCYFTGMRVFWESRGPPKRIKFGIYHFFLVYIPLLQRPQNVVREGPRRARRGGGVRRGAWGS